jgi:predicted dienelactone hydrolase
MLLLLCPITANVSADATRTADTYDPLQRSDRTATEPIDLTVNDRARSRDIPILVYLPVDQDPAPVVLFSHGLGGSRRNNAYLGEHWSARGYAAVFLQHPGSDESVWRDIAPRDRLKAMRNAADTDNFLLRVQDVPVVLDRLQAWNEQTDHALRGRLDLKCVGMSGHSFGALTTQALAGQQFPFGRDFVDGRIRAAVMMSPSAPRRGSVDFAFAAVTVPWLLMTGTHDNALITNADAASRLRVFPALPPGDKYELVLDKAEHSAFTDRALPGDRQPRNPNHHRAVLATSTAFWDAYLRDDPSAKEWLQTDAVKRVLEPGDAWRGK